MPILYLTVLASNGIRWTQMGNMASSASIKRTMWFSLSNYALHLYSNHDNKKENAKCSGYWVSPKLFIHFISDTPA